MDINSKNKKLCLEPLRGIVTQGEKLADTVTFRLPNVYGNLTLSALSWQLRAASEKNTLATADLTASASGEFCLVQWEVSADFTAVSGALSLMLVGTDSAGNVVIKFPGDDPIWVRDAETGQYSPPEDAIQKALNGLQQAESALEEARESLENATKALQDTEANFRILGHYDSLSDLQSSVPDPSLGDAYGVGNPTVVYVWDGLAWAQLPGVLVSPALPMSVANGGTGATTNIEALKNLGAQASGNLLVNSRFKYNGRNQTSYTGGALTVDGWNSASGSVTITLPDGVTVANAASISQLVQQDSTLFSKSATFSVEDSTDTVYSVSATMPESAQNTSSQIASQSTPWGSISIWNSNTGSAFSVVISATSAVTLTAAKLEIGSVSTLAADLATAQDETIEQLRLDMYDLDPGRPARILTQNKNLLDNWYFVGGGSQQGGSRFPINQRGQASYTSAGYGIDRWTATSSDVTVSVLSSGVQLSTAGGASVRQIIENYNDYAGKTVTISALISKPQITGRASVRLRVNGSFSSYYVNFTGGKTYASASFSLPSELTSLYFEISAENASYVILAAKLELGTRSTLARLVNGEWVLNDPPPNFQQELAKCQRYLKSTYVTQNVCVTDSDSQIQTLLMDPSIMRIKTPTGIYLSPTIYAHQVEANSVIDITGSAFTINNFGSVITIKDSRFEVGKFYIISTSSIWQNFVSDPVEILVSAEL